MFRRLCLLFSLVLLFGLSARAQTTVNLTVQDTPDNQTWNNGSWSVQWIPPGQPTQSGTIISGGGSLNPQSGSLSSGGTATMSLPANANIVPVNSQWQFTVCPQATSPCFSQTFTIPTFSPTAITITPPSPRPSASPLTLAYSPTEVMGGFGSMYFDLTLNLLRFCTTGTLTTCSVWSTGGGGGGTPGGLNTAIQTNCSGAFCGDSTNFFYISSTHIATATGGFVSAMFQSSSSNPAATGVVRLANTDTVSFRNGSNSADLPLGVSSVNNLQFGGVPVPPISGSVTGGRCIQSVLTGSLITLAETSNPGCTGGAFSNGLGSGYQDASIISSPGTPASGNLRIYAVSSISGIGSSAWQSVNSSGGFVSFYSPAYNPAFNAVNSNQYCVFATTPVVLWPTGTASLYGYSAGCVINPETGTMTLSGTLFASAIGNGTTATTQSNGDNSAQIATDAFVINNSVTNPMTTAADMIIGGASGAPTRLAGPTGVNGVAYVPTSTPAGGVAGSEVWQIPVFSSRAITGTTSTDTVLVTDNNNEVVQVQAATGIVTQTLPTATTLGISNFAYVQCANSPNTFTVQPTTWTIQAGNSSASSTLVIQPGQCYRIHVDPSSSTNWLADLQGASTSSVTNFSSGNLSPLFTTSVANPTTTPSQTFSLSNAAQNSVFAGPSTGGSGAPSYRALVLSDLPGPADTTTTVSESTTINANTCTQQASITMTGLTSSMTINFTATSDTSTVTGWGLPTAGLLYITDYPTSNTVTWSICNPTNTSITTSSAVTFNVSAR